MSCGIAFTGLCPLVAISAVSTVLSFVGLQFFTDLSLDKLTSDRLIGWNLIHLDNASQDIELPLGLYTTIGLLVNCMINAVFFTELYASETRKLVESFINYVIYKCNDIKKLSKMKVKVNPELLQLSRSGLQNVEGKRIHDFFLTLATCNTIVPLVVEC
ncbi:hypothetical protein JHK85_036801 [Glycine max]|nr:hypothetical protein JHK85_036801 [Glycine max]